jgi:hypothetical protein
MNLVGSTILAWLNVAGWLVVFVLLGNSQTIFADNNGLQVSFSVALAGWMIVCTVLAFRDTIRCLELMDSWRDPDYVDNLARKLDALDAETAQILLMRLKKRFTAETCEPKSEPVKKAPPPTDTSPILEPLRRGAAETLERLGDAIKDTLMDWTPGDGDNWEPAEVPLPPMQTQQFVATLRAPVEAVLGSLAETINAATDARAVLDTRERCQELLGAFLDGALEVSLKLRVDAAMAELPALQASGGSVEWHAADPGLRGPTRSWVEKYRRMKADEINLP